MDKQQLKPCPFCGGHNVSFTSPDGPNDKIHDFVICGDCGATCNEIDTRPELDCQTVWNRRFPQPPSASGERERFEKWRHTQADSLRRCGYPSAADEFIRLGSVQWAGWQARAALAPSPGVDAAEQKPVYTIQVRGALHAWEPTAQAVELTNGTYNLYAAPSPAPSADTDKRFPFYELRFIMRVLSHEGSAPKEDWQTAYGMAHAVFERWSKDRATVPAASADEWMAEVDRLVEQLEREWVKAVSHRRAPAAAIEARAALLAHLKARP